MTRTDELLRVDLSFSSWTCRRREILQRYYSPLRSVAPSLGASTKKVNVPTQPGSGLFMQRDARLACLLVGTFVVELRPGISSFYRRFSLIFSAPLIRYAPARIYREMILWLVSGILSLLSPLLSS